MQLDAFAAALARLGVARDDRLAVAVSGGSDSLGLLLLAAATRPGCVHALTVDHALRADSAAEAEAVARAAAAHDVPHVTLLWSGERGRGGGGNLQAGAREARYALMADWCRTAGVRWLATAHHADDQAETVLMRLARGSGVAGLSGIRERRSLRGGVELLRPLLAARKRDLAMIAAAAGLEPADDPSNHDSRYDRTRARTLLAATPWLDPARIAESASHLVESEAALDWAADRAWAGRATTGEDGLAIDCAGLPRALRLRLLAHAIAVVGGSAADGPETARLLATLDAGGTATLGGVRASGGTVWLIRPAPPRRR